MHGWRGRPLLRRNCDEQPPTPNTLGTPRQLVRLGVFNRCRVLAFQARCRHLASSALFLSSPSPSASPALYISLALSLSISRELSLYLCLSPQPTLSSNVHGVFAHSAEISRFAAGLLSNKNVIRSSNCACHPCAGAMRIFSVSFQF